MDIFPEEEPEIYNAVRCGTVLGPFARGTFP